MSKALAMVAAMLMVIMAVLLEPVPAWTEEPTQRTQYSVTVQNGYIYIIDLEEQN